MMNKERKVVSNQRIPLPLRAQSSHPLDPLSLLSKSKLQLQLSGGAGLLEQLPSTFKETKNKIKRRWLTRDGGFCRDLTTRLSLGYHYISYCNPQERMGAVFR